MSRNATGKALLALDCFGNSIYSFYKNQPEVYEYIQYLIGVKGKNYFHDEYDELLFTVGDEEKELQTINNDLLINNIDRSKHVVVNNSRISPLRFSTTVKDKFHNSFRDETVLIGNLDMISILINLLNVYEYNFYIDAMGVYGDDKEAILEVLSGKIDEYHIFNF